jgi:hypothetical protein
LGLAGELVSHIDLHTSGKAFKNIHDQAGSGPIKSNGAPGLPINFQQYSAIDCAVQHNRRATLQHASFCAATSKISSVFWVIAAIAKAVNHNALHKICANAHSEDA